MSSRIVTHDPGILFEGRSLPCLVHIGSKSNSDSNRRSMHMHQEFAEIIFMRDGSGNCIIANHNYSVSKGDIMIFNSSVLHDEQINPQHTYKQYSCGITGFQLPGLAPGRLLADGVSPVAASNHHYQAIETLYEMMLKVVDGETENQEIVCQYLVSALVATVLPIFAARSLAKEVEQKPSVAQLIKIYLDQNYAKDVSLTDISDKFYISTYYATRLFKEFTGFSINQYVLRRRIGEAQSLLMYSILPITEVSQAVGIENPNYFNVIFRKAIDLSPSAFRRLYKDHSLSKKQQEK